VSRNHHSPNNLLDPQVLMRAFVPEHHGAPATSPIRRPFRLPRYAKHRAVTRWAEEFRTTTKLVCRHVYLECACGQRFVVAQAGRPSDGFDASEEIVDSHYHLGVAAITEALTTVPLAEDRCRVVWLDGRSS
jgi:hypothetical protein